jgi:hypothetical protein
MPDSIEIEDLKNRLRSHLLEIVRERDPYLSTQGHFYVQTYIQQTLWSAKYDLFVGVASLKENRLAATTPMMTIQEDDPWIKVFDALFSEIPILGMFTGYVFNPSYTLARSSGMNVMKLSKIPGFLSRNFTIQKVDSLDDRTEIQAILSILMMIFLERSRG